MSAIDDINKLREKISEINLRILELLSKRGEVVQEIGELKHQVNLAMYDPLRESEEIVEVVPHNKGPFSDETVTYLFNEIFRASLDLLSEDKHRKLLVSRAYHAEDTEIAFANGVGIGGRNPTALIAGPCAVETEEQMEAVASAVKKLGVRFIRGGACKPRTSPYSFQGVGLSGYDLLADVARRHGLLSVSEVLDNVCVEAAADKVDVIQIGTRNMSNFRLLEAARYAGKPVLLKRGFMSTYEEFLLAAEYIAQDNANIILCERGIRTFEHWTRYTLDISAVPILKKRSHLPVIVDVSHAAGRRDILLPLARAALAAGADGIMVEVHPSPNQALSDTDQQIDIPAFERFFAGLKDLLKTERG